MWHHFTIQQIVVKTFYIVILWRGTKKIELLASLTSIFYMFSEFKSDKTGDKCEAEMRHLQMVSIHIIMGQRSVKQLV